MFAFTRFDEGREVNHRPQVMQPHRKQRRKTLHLQHAFPVRCPVILGRCTSASPFRHPRFRESRRSQRSIRASHSKAGLQSERAQPEILRNHAWLPHTPIRWSIGRRGAPKAFLSKREKVRAGRSQNEVPLSSGFALRTVQHAPIHPAPINSAGQHDARHREAVA